MKPRVPQFPKVRTLLMPLTLQSHLNSPVVITLGLVVITRKTPKVAGNDSDSGSDDGSCIVRRSSRNRNRDWADDQFGSSSTEDEGEAEFSPVESDSDF